MLQKITRLKLGRVLHLSFDEYPVVDYAIKLFVEVLPESVISTAANASGLVGSIGGIFCIPVHLYFSESDEHPGWYDASIYMSTTCLQRYASEEALLLNYPSAISNVHFRASEVDTLMFEHVINALVKVNVLERGENSYRFKEDNLNNGL